MTQEPEKKQVDPAEAKLRRQMAVDAGTLAVIVKAIQQKYGDEALEVMRNALNEATLAPTRSKARRAGARVGDGGIEDWIKLEEYMAKESLCDYEVEVSPERGVMRVLDCPMKDAYTAICPDVCTKVLIGAEQAFATAINPNLQSRVDCYMPLGAKSCDVVCEFKPGTKP